MEATQIKLEDWEKKILIVINRFPTKKLLVTPKEAGLLISRGLVRKTGKERAYRHEMFRRVVCEITKKGMEAIDDNI